MRSIGPRTFLSCVSVSLVVAGCNDHRYGFFGDSEGEAGSETATGDPTTTFGPTTVSPTTITTTTVGPTTVGPTTVTTTTVPTTGPTTITSDPVTSVTTVTTVGPNCGDLILPSTVPVQGLAPLSGGADTFTLSCGGFGGSDVAFVWTVPFNGRFAIDTVGSNFDSLLGVLDGVCGGVELACNDDGGVDLSSRVELDLFAGQTLTLVVDSFGPTFGDVVLNINEVPIVDSCPDGDFGSQVPFTIPGQTAGASNVRAGSCGGFDSPEIEATWTAPFDGLFRFVITEADFVPVLYLRDSICEGVEFACSSDAIVDVPLAGGQTVVVVVDGQAGTSGNFTLAIDQL